MRLIEPAEPSVGRGSRGRESPASTLGERIAAAAAAAAAIHLAERTLAQESRGERGCLVVGRRERGS